MTISDNMKKQFSWVSTLEKADPSIMAAKAHGSHYRFQFLGNTLDHILTSVVDMKEGHFKAAHYIFSMMYKASNTYPRISGTRPSWYISGRDEWMKHRGIGRRAYGGALNSLEQAGFIERQVEMIGKKGGRTHYWMPEKTTRALHIINSVSKGKYLTEKWSFYDAWGDVFLVDKEDLRSGWKLLIAQDEESIAKIFQDKVIKAAKAHAMYPPDMDAKPKTYIKAASPNSDEGDKATPAELNDILNDNVIKFKTTGTK